MSKLNEYDYVGVAAIGDVQYSDNFDKWEDIKSALKNKKEIIIVPNHNSNSKDVIGKVRYWEFCDQKKELKIGINKEDLTVGLDAFNKVSPQWQADINGRIIDINHFAISNSLSPLCDQSVCNIVKNRAKEKMTEDLQKKIEDLQAKNQALMAEKLEIENKYAELETEFLKRKYESFEEFLKQKKEEPEEQEPDLSEKKDIEQDIETKPAFKAGKEHYSILGNTTQNTEEIMAKRQFK